jgi:hypothetical protein
MAELYPPIEPYDQRLLDVGDGNLVHWETCGSPRGKPVVAIHGGPGQGSTPEHAADLRSGTLPGGAVRPARLRTEHPARQRPPSSGAARTTTPMPDGSKRMQ